MATITQEVEVEVEIYAENVSDYVQELDSEDAKELAEECLQQMNARHIKQLAAEILKEETDTPKSMFDMAENLVEELDADRLIALIKEVLGQVDIETSQAIFEHSMNRVQELQKEEQDDEDLRESLKKDDLKGAANTKDDEGYML